MAYTSPFGEYPTLESQFNPVKGGTASPSYPGQATTGPVQSTGAVSGAPSAWTMQGGSFSPEDWTWRDPTEETKWYSGDSEGIQTPYSAGGWYLTDAARQRMGAWGTDNQSNVSWEGGLNPLQNVINRNDQKYWQGGAAPGTIGGDAGLGTFNEAAYQADLAALKANNPLLQGNFQGKMKTADKQGTIYNWNGLNGPTGPGQVVDWDTNNGQMNRKALMAFAALAGGGMLGNYLMAGNVLGAGAGAGTGVVSEGAALGGLGGVEPITTSGFTAAQGGVGSLGAGWGMPGGVVAGEAGAITGSTAPSLYDTIKQGYDTYSKVKKGYNMVNNLTQPSPIPRTGATGGTSWMQDLAGGVGGLADLWGAIEGSRQTKDMSGNLKQIYTDALARRQPYVDRLGQSYADPNSFYDSNQWKGLSSVYQNSLDRGAASTGRLANPTDREVKLNNYALKELENYRQGLRGAADTLSPNFALAPMVSGIQAEARANNPYGALIGDQRTGRYSGVSGAVGDLAKVFGGIEKIPGYLKEALGLGSDVMQSMPGFDYDTVFGGGVEPGIDWMSGGFGSGNLPGGSDLLSNFGGFDLGDAGGFGFDDISEWF